MPVKLVTRSLDSRVRVEPPRAWEGSSCHKTGVGEHQKKHEMRSPLFAPTCTIHRSIAEHRTPVELTWQDVARPAKRGTAS